MQLNESRERIAVLKIELKAIQGTYLMVDLVFNLNIDLVLCFKSQKRAN